MKTLRLRTLLLPILLFSMTVVADEGMWLYNAFPKAAVKARYGFEPTQSWLDHVRLSSVRFNNGGSGSFVSPDGLAFTNHHVGATCVHQLSTGGKDYLKTGFYAATREQEAKCPDLELNVLVDISDVTAEVKGAVAPGTAAADVAKLQRTAMSKIEKACATSTGLRCDVVTFYSGQVYHLYQYKKYTDVRLVFAPEYEAAFFGGDPDNFTYPRYDLDITFFRIYENDKPVHLEHYLRWSATGVKDNDLIFVSGHPGTTIRLRTVAQLELLRDVDYPNRLQTYRRRIDALKKFGAESEENARIAQEDIFGLENAFKAISGYENGLKDVPLFERKASEERKLRQAVAADPKKKEELGDPWSTLEHSTAVYREIYQPLVLIERMRGFASELAGFARTLVRVTQEKTKPSDTRLREYRDSALPSLEQGLFSTAPVYKSLDTLLLTTSLTQMQETLGQSNATVQKILGGRTPAEAAKDLITNTKLDDVAVRKQLYEGGTAAADASTDPLIVLMRSIDADGRALRKRADDEIDAVERTAGAAVAKARFAESGFNTPPDATFTLRLSYGAVKGFTENGKSIPYFTTFDGAFQHSAEHGNKDPYHLPDSWTKAKDKINLKTPFNYVSTADIIGGNSGSPTVNKAGEIVGIIFDGNIQSLAWNFAFDDKVGRSVHVDSRGIQEALRNIYGASALADELLGSAKKADISTKSSTTEKKAAN